MRADVSFLPRAAWCELHTLGVLFHIVLEVIAALDLSESCQSHSQRSSYQEPIDTAHCGHRVLSHAADGQV